VAQKSRQYRENVEELCEYERKLSQKLLKNGCSNIISLFHCEEHINWNQTKILKIKN